MKADPSGVDKSPGAGRPRDPRIDASILQSAAELLVTVGYSHLTMAAIAEHAGTTKTALYRRWSSKAELVHEAVFPATPAAALMGAPGSLADDIRAMIAAGRDVFNTPVVRAALPGLVAEVAADPELNARVMERFGALFAAIHDRVSRAVENGDAGPHANADRLIEVIGGATMMRLLLRPEEEFDDEWVDQTTAIILHGIVKR
jgi:AcrR family transcriptional regulator